MPVILNKSIHSFSSEDPAFPAKNLCENKTTARWKCQNPGEKVAFVVLKFDKPYTISSIDIGNEHSAFIEISVANSKQDPPVYKELLLSSSFMTEKEVRNGLNPNRIRFFENKSFVESVSVQKWDLLKVTCSQPMTNRKQYGVAFLTIYTSDKIDEEITSSQKFSNTSIIEVKKEEKYQLKKPSPTAVKIGKFAFRDSSSDDDAEDTSPFKQWKLKKDTKAAAATTPKFTATITKPEQKPDNLTRKRIHSSSDEDDMKIKPKVKQDRNRTKGLMYDSDDDEPNERLQKKLDLDRKLKEEKKEPPKIPVNSSPKPNKFASFLTKASPSNQPKASTSSSPQTRPKTPTTKPKKEPKYKPFEKLLDGVTFVISGYQNPERGNLRQKAIDMGARYKADWDDNSCTHLICAFANTPKFNQVKGKGKIVSKKWIESCFSEQKRLPWRRFAVDRDDKDISESEEEIHSEWKKSKPIIADSDSDGDMVVIDKRGTKKSPIKPIEIKDEEVVKLETEDEDEQKENLSMEIDSDSSIDITQVECEAYKNKVFYLNADLPASTSIKFKHIIKNMLGSLTKDVSKANYIVTKNGKSLPQNKYKAEVIKDTWVEECHELQALLPTTRYKL